MVVQVDPVVLAQAQLVWQAIRHAEEAKRAGAPPRSAVFDQTHWTLSALQNMVDSSPEMVYALYLAGRQQEDDATQALIKAVQAYRASRDRSLHWSLLPWPLSKEEAAMFAALTVLEEGQ